MATDQSKDKPTAKQPEERSTKGQEAYRRAWRARRRASGVCTTCGGERDIPGRVRCRTCQVKDSENSKRRRKANREEYNRKNTASVRRRREARKAQGLCSTCGSCAPQAGNVDCEECLRRGCERQKRYGKARRDQGLCRHCGVPSGPCSYCQKCKQEAKAIYERTMAEAQGTRQPVQGLLRCTGCGKDKPGIAFSVSLRNATGRSSQCKACKRERTDYAKLAVKRYHRELRLAALQGKFTKAQWRAIKHGQNHRCARCGRQEPTIKLTVDHIVPVVQGGPNSAENVQALCRSCNCHKGTKSTDYRPRLAQWLK